MKKAERRLAMAYKTGVLGIFLYADNFLAGLKSLDGSGFLIQSVFSPTPLHEVQGVLASKSTPVRYYTLAGGILGFVLGFSLAAYANLQWNFITSGKPVLAWLPFVVVGFEFTILLGVLATVLGMLIHSRLPRLRIPDFYDPRFTEDRLGVFIPCQKMEIEKVMELLRGAGAEEVREVR